MTNNVNEASLMSLRKLWKISHLSRFIAYLVPKTVYRGSSKIASPKIIIKGFVKCIAGNLVPAKPLCFYRGYSCHDDQLF